MCVHLCLLKQTWVDQNYRSLLHHICCLLQFHSTTTTPKRTQVLVSISILLQTLLTLNKLWLRVQICAPFYLFSSPPLLVLRFPWKRPLSDTFHRNKKGVFLVFLPVCVCALYMTWYDSALKMFYVCWIQSLLDDRKGAMKK